ncbi:hypothetical protein FBU59_000425 [Linderina macrospora]|uniref:Uncharacterized protein n=1 Tax=Linderina macrospora TaxID=4868 RepID=A0ACC1JH50_9FUNG|nr:hypothetical protein FBU59_000425 [Linderina macrospora]
MVISKRPIARLQQKRARKTRASIAAVKARMLVLHREQRFLALKTQDEQLRYRREKTAQTDYTKPYWTGTLAVRNRRLHALVILKMPKSWINDYEKRRDAYCAQIWLHEPQTGLSSYLPGQGGLTINDKHRPLATMEVVKKWHNNTMRIHMPRILDFQYQFDRKTAYGADPGKRCTYTVSNYAGNRGLQIQKRTWDEMSGQNNYVHNKRCITNAISAEVFPDGRK